MSEAVPPRRELQQRQSQRPLALTMGDPAGIGLDIVLAAWAARDRRPLPPLVLLACPDAVTERARALGMDVGVGIAASLELAALSIAGADGALPVLPVPLARKVVPGSPDPANAAGVIAAIERAVAETVAGRAAAVVTCPISKATLYAAGFEHPGHTEFLGALAARHDPSRVWTPVMMLASEQLG